MIGTKNFWLNTLGFLAVSIALYIVYSAIEIVKPDVRVMFWLTGAIFVCSALMTITNRTTSKTKQEIELRAYSTELQQVEKRLDQHIIDNRDTYDKLFELQTKTNDTVNDIYNALIENNKKKR